MRQALAAIALFLTIQVFSQSPELKEVVSRLDKALLQKDTVALSALLQNDVSYGHSNGWVQSKRDVIADMLNGKLGYNKIESTDLTYTEKENWASVRSIAEVEYLLNGKKGEMTLHVLQVWNKTSNGWVLVARQSTKIN